MKRTQVVYKSFVPPKPGLTMAEIKHRNAVQGTRFNGRPAMYLACFQVKVKDHLHLAGLSLIESHFGVKSPRHAQKIQDLFNLEDLRDEDVAYDINAVHWNRLEEPYDHAFVVGPFDGTDRSQKEFKAVMERMKGYGQEEFCMPIFVGPYDTLPDASPVNSDTEADKTEDKKEGEGS